MSYNLKQGTASTVMIGPFLDITDGNTQENGLTIANTEIKLHKKDAVALVDKSAGGATSVGSGYYTIALDAADTDTLGDLTIIVHQVANALPTKFVAKVVEANVYDSLYGTGDNLEVDLVLMEGVAGTSLPSTQASVDGLNDISTVEVRAEVDGGITAASLSTFDETTDQVIVATNNDKTGYSISGGVDVTAINGDSAAAVNLALAAGVIVPGAAVSGTLSTTQMSTNLTEATDSHYNSAAVVWTSGALVGQRSNITGYAGASKVLTFSEITEAPSAGDTFILV
jgi:hypothetical protein